MGDDFCLSSISAALAAAREALRRDKMSLEVEDDAVEVPRDTSRTIQTTTTDGSVAVTAREGENSYNQSPFSYVSTKEAFDDTNETKNEYLFKKYSTPNIAMLKTGEYSPNNPDFSGGDRTYRGDVFLGLGLYEEKRKKLLVKRQNEYREYLAKQTQLNVMRKEQMLQEKKRLERELAEGESKKLTNNNAELKDAADWLKDINSRHSRSRRPSSIGVQTDPDELALLALERRSSTSVITPAERELSPRPSINTNTSDWRMLVEKVNIGTQNNLIIPSKVDNPKGKYTDDIELVSAYMGNKFLDNDYLDDLNKNVYRKDSPRARLLQDLSHTYMPSLFDADAIRQRNAKLEEDAALKRTKYQQELKKQIEEQQRIREERKIREKLLEEAETRRLEDQLKALQLAHESEIERQKELSIKLRNDAVDYEKRRSKLQSDIDAERKREREMLSKINSQKDREAIQQNSNNNPKTKARSDSKLDSSHAVTSHRPRDLATDFLSYNVRRNNPYVGQDVQHFSENSPETSTFSQSIPVKSHNSSESVPYSMEDRKSRVGRSLRLPKNNDEVKIKTNALRTKPSYEPAFLRKNITDMIDVKGIERKKNCNFDDSLPIPVLRAPEKRFDDASNSESKSGHSQNGSEAMRNLERRWQVPAVQKNILKNNRSEDGKQENILTQLGSIRKQLQLEQMKLDQSHYFNDNNKLVK